VRSLAIVILRLWFRVRVSGAEHIPSDGPAIAAPNHKNFLDALLRRDRHPSPRPLQAKVELFKGALGWLFLRLGAFPVRRGEADAEALQTARSILPRAGSWCCSPREPESRRPTRWGRLTTAPSGSRSRRAVEHPRRPGGARDRGLRRA
jgi:1-acyl-sn-glycerol-3-phosphate acyltransferase